MMWSIWSLRVARLAAAGITAQAVAVQAATEPQL
jgi:hypothetical protein